MINKSRLASGIEPDAQLPPALLRKATHAASCDTLVDLVNESNNKLPDRDEEQRLVAAP